MNKIVKLFFLISLINFSFAEIGEKRFMGVMFNISADSVENVLVVDKSRQKLQVISSNNPKEFGILHSFRVSTGKVKGNKEIRGDMKTPEGIYTILDSIPGKRMPAKYGPLAFILNYPNTVDRLFSRTGSDIWIHGRNEDIIDRQTEGCVSLENSHILDLEPFVTITKTRVIIVDTLDYYTNEEYLKKSAEWEQLILNWKNAWIAGNLNNYFTYYSKHYKGLESFKRGKKNIENQYAWKKIDLNKIVVFVSEHEAEARFHQEFICPRFRSKGTKTMVLIPEEDGWKIQNERIVLDEECYYFDKPIQEFIQKWKTSWESGKIDDYIMQYNADFATKEHDLQSYYKFKKAKFLEAGNIILKLGDAKITSHQEYVWKVRFRQRYESEVYRDIGYKTLYLKLENEKFSIINEEWSRRR